MKKLFFLALMCFMTLSISAQYVDLGLPSGTKWNSTNEEGFYNYEKAISKYGNKLPAKWQWKELRSQCSLVWNGYGCVVTGKNGNSIFLPAAGFVDCDGTTDFVGEIGYYWSASQQHCIWITDDEISGGDGCNSCVGQAVRLVR